MNTLYDPRVAIVVLPSASYTDGQLAPDAISKALARLGDLLGWSESGAGPFAGVIPAGASVLAKPNWVSHENQGPWGLDPLITHGSLVRTAVRGLLRSDASEILVGDAPLQLCDFERLLAGSGLHSWARELAARQPCFRGIRDFRRTTCNFEDGIRVAVEDRIPQEQFVLFDLGLTSLLESVTDSGRSFRVTQYDPTHMVRTHARGRHQYLIARAALEADVVLNLPKLKTHRKAGVTCALKNLIGINGNKEYLPHHRVGGAQSGGDCYPGRSLIKRTLEYAFDRLNLARSPLESRFWLEVTRALGHASRRVVDQLGVEGSWCGNDTIWRTCLDLNRILLYGRPDGSVADELQRDVLHVVDAVVAGQGEGPLAPEPLPLGIIFAGRNAAAVDWVGAQLLGYDPTRIPIVREAFGNFRWPITKFVPSDIFLLGDWGAGKAEELLTSVRKPSSLIYPMGWKDAVSTTAAPG